MTNAFEPAANELLVEVTEAGNEQFATIRWGDRGQQQSPGTGPLGPMPVAEALRRADELAASYGFANVVVSMPGAEGRSDGSHRRTVSPGATDSPDLYEADDGDEGRVPLSLPPDDD
jgi:hypothetical protein